MQSFSSCLLPPWNKQQRTKEEIVDVLEQQLGQKFLVTNYLEPLLGSAVEANVDHGDGAITVVVSIVHVLDIVPLFRLVKLAITLDTSTILHIRLLLKELCLLDSFQAVKSVEQTIISFGFIKGHLAADY